MSSKLVKEVTKEEMLRIVTFRYQKDATEYIQKLQEISDDSVIEKKYELLENYWYKLMVLAASAHTHIESLKRFY